MGRVIKLIIYYFAYQFAFVIPGVAGYTAWQFVKTGTFSIDSTMPISFALILSILSTLMMAWHLLHYKYIKLDKQTLATTSGKVTCLYLIMGIAAMLWMNWLSEMIELPNLFENTFAQMKDNVFGILSVCIIAPIFEELFFRGAIEGHLLRIWKNPRWSILVSALVFGAIHGNPAQIFFAFLFGLILGELYYRTGSLLPCIILHFINNTTSVIMMNIFEQEDTLTDIIGNSSTVHSIGMLAIGIFCLTTIMLRKAVKPMDWQPENNTIEATNQ